MLALGADREPQEEEFGILCLRVEPQFSDKPLTHRDYLGSLMGLGIKRESVGDIAVLPEGGALVYAKQPAARLIEEELSTVGRSAVRVTKAGPLVPPAAGNAVRGGAPLPVPSLLPGCRAGVMLHLGRSAAAQLIKKRRGLRQPYRNVQRTLRGVRKRRLPCARIRKIQIVQGRSTKQKGPDHHILLPILKRGILL